MSSLYHRPCASFAPTTNAIAFPFPALPLQRQGFRTFSAARWVCRWAAWCSRAEGGCGAIGSKAARQASLGHCIPKVEASVAAQMGEAMATALQGGTCTKIPSKGDNCIGIVFYWIVKREHQSQLV